jgi:hypothetical protein
VIVSVPVVMPLPRAEVRVIVMPPVPGKAKEVGVLSGRVENPAVLGFDQMSSARAGEWPATAKNRRESVKARSGRIGAAARWLIGREAGGLLNIGTQPFSRRTRLPI